MTVRMWEVEFGQNWARVIVAAPNYKDAVRNAIIKRRETNDYLTRTQDITKVELIAEED